MNNTEKLLRAFIEASGFEVSPIVDNSMSSQGTIIDYKVTKEPCNELGIIEWNSMTNSEKIMILKANIEILENEKT